VSINLLHYTVVSAPPECLLHPQYGGQKAIDMQI